MPFNVTRKSLDCITVEQISFYIPNVGIASSPGSQEGGGEREMLN